MTRLLQALRPAGTRRGRRDPLRVTLGQEPRHRAPRSNWLLGDYATAPEVDDLFVELLIGRDPRWTLQGDADQATTHPSRWNL